MDDKIIFVSDFWAAVNGFVDHHFVKIIVPKEKCPLNTQNNAKELATKNTKSHKNNGGGGCPELY
jgi:hypothetical protein